MATSILGAGFTPLSELRCFKVPDAGVAELSFDNAQNSEPILPICGDELNLSLSSCGGGLSSPQTARVYYTEAYFQPGTQGVLFATGRRPVQMSGQPPKKV